MRFLLSAALAACLVTPALAAKEPQGPGCFTATRAMEVVHQHDGAVAARLDGKDAEALVAIINNTGEPTDFHAQTVIVVLYPDHAGVALFNACHEHDVAIDLKAFSEIWASFRGVRV